MSSWKCFSLFIIAILLSNCASSLDKFIENENLNSSILMETEQEYWNYDNFNVLNFNEESLEFDSYIVPESNDNLRGKKSNLKLDNFEEIQIKPISNEKLLNQINTVIEKYEEQTQKFTRINHNILNNIEPFFPKEALNLFEVYLDLLPNLLENNKDMYQNIFSETVKSNFQESGLINVSEDVFGVINKNRVLSINKEEIPDLSIDEYTRSPEDIFLDANKYLHMFNEDYNFKEDNLDKNDLCSEDIFSEAIEFMDIFNEKN